MVSLRTALATAAGAWLVFGSASLSAATEPSLRAVKFAAAKYRDVKVAIAEGYTTDGKCTTAAMLGYPASQGAMGLHYVRKDLLGIGLPSPGRVRGTGTYTNFKKPSMLVYEPQPDASLRLVAVENLVFESAWRAAGHLQPPQFHGVRYVLLKDDPKTPIDEAHNFEPHYELHVWSYRRNPIGTFAEFNPQVTCRHNKTPPAHM